MMSDLLFSVDLFANEDNEKSLLGLCLGYFLMSMSGTSNMSFHVQVTISLVAFIP